MYGNILLFLVIKSNFKVDFSILQIYPYKASPDGKAGQPKFFCES